MFLRHRPLGATVVLAFSLLSYGCDENGTTRQIVGPSRVGTTAAFVSRATLVQPSFSGPEIVPGAVCPTLPPFRAPVSLIFEGDGRSDLSLSRLHMQFTDHVGVAGESLTVGRTELQNRFGSTRLPAFGTRTLPFSFPFGCVGAPTGTLTVIVFAADSRGRENSSRVLIPIRFPS